MTLISCPECCKSVSDYATACPNCGFPVAAGIRQAVAEVTEEGRTKSARQQGAANRLKTWGERYLDPEGAQRAAEGDGFLDRHWRPVVFLIAVVIIALQLTFVFSVMR